jgi:inward rectifier potassium channel
MKPSRRTDSPPTRRRLGDREGVIFQGLPDGRWRDAYHLMLTIPTPAFLAVMALAYLLINVAFAGLYMLDPHGVTTARPGRFADYFFFSVQTLVSLGYGVLAPQSLYANVLVTCESFVGLFNLGVATGLLFARISRPTARIIFSRIAVVAPLNGVPTLTLRAANHRRNLVLEAEVSLTLVHDVVTVEGDLLRRFDTLTPVRQRTPLFFLSWQIMHLIVPGSPLHGQSAESLAARNAEILVIIRGVDETFAAQIHARTSYLPDEIVWGARLADVLTTRADGRRVLNFDRFHELDPGRRDGAADPSPDRSDEAIV